MINKILIGFVLMWVVSVGNADRVWLHQGVYVEDVTVFGEDTGYTVMLVKIKGYEGSSECASADSGYIYAITSGNFSSNWQLMYSTILSAQAQNIPVDFLVDDATCSTSSAYAGYPDGLGRKFKGVRIDGPAT